jgi:hypothetical protein
MFSCIAEPAVLILFSAGQPSQEFFFFRVMSHLSLCYPYYGEAEEITGVAEGGRDSSSLAVFT